MIKIDVRKTTKWGNDMALFVSFPFNTELVNFIKALPCRVWHIDEKEWEIPFNKLEELLTKFKEYDTIEITADDSDIFQDKEEQLDFDFKTTPFKHQIDGFKYGLTHKRWLLGDEQGLGKALALDTKVYTPNGYKRMRDIEVGDFVFGKDGKPTKVTAVYNHSNVEMYRITFSDGVSVECCKDHLWQIHDQHGIKVVDTKWFTEKDQFGQVRKNNLRSDGSKCYKYWIDRCEPVQFEYQNIPINAYVLGALLGDGGLTSNSVFFTTADKEMVDNINTRLPKGYRLYSSYSMNDIEFYIQGTKGRVNVIKKGLIDLNLWGTNSHTKFIPDLYKYNSIAVRTEVLQGLIDTDGYATTDNLLQYTTVSKQLCEDVRFLVESLGGMVSYSEKNCGYNGKITSTCYTLTIKFDRPQLYCTLARKKSLLNTRRFKTRRNIVAVERIENADAKCITVDNTESLYLIDHFVVTHNTKQVIDIAVASKAMYGYKHCLIVCGVNGLKWNWVNEIATHSNEKAWILGQTIKNHKTVIDSNAKKYNDLLDLRNGVDVPIKDSYFLVTNVESLRDENIVSILSELCKDGTIGLIAADECHKMKNAQSQQGKGFLKLQADTMIAMTGTPLMNSPLDLYIILKWLGYESHSFYSFKNHYCVMGGYGNYQVIGYKHLDNLQAQLNDFMLRRLKKDVLDLPEKTFIDEYVEMTAKQTQIYKEVYNNIIANIDKVAKAVNPLAEMIRLRQATGYTGILSSTIAESAKLDRMEELVDDAVENGKKVVIFSNWTQMTDVIFDRLAKKYNGCLITGDTKDEARQNLVNLFQDGQFEFIVGTIGAMGTGLTLTEGSVEIFLDEPWNMALKDQAVDRCHRIGQQNNITIYTLLTKNTIDERIHELVTKKGAMSDAIVDGKISGDKRALIDYLLA